MIEEKWEGAIKGYKLVPTIHSKEKRGKIPRDSLSKTKYHNLITSALNKGDLPEGEFQIIFEHKEGVWKSLIIINNSKELKLKTTFLTNNKLHQLEKKHDINIILNKDEY